MDPQTQPTPNTPPTPPERPVSVPPRVSPATNRLVPQRPTPIATAPQPTSQIASPPPPATQQPIPQQPTTSITQPAMPPSNQPLPITPSANEVLQKAEQNDKHRSIGKKLRGFASFITFIATVVIAAMLINTFIFQSYYVDGTSMTPTLQNEDRLIIEKVGKTTTNLQGKTYLPTRGEIVVLDSAILDQYGHQEQLIKRVIGLPGDTVIIKEGIVTIKNKEFPDGFNVDQKLGINLETTYSETPIEVPVPEDNIYVLGDNRGINGSLDSRSFGVVTSDKVQGRLAIRIFPFNRTQFFN